MSTLFISRVRGFLRSATLAGIVAGSLILNVQGATTTGAAYTGTFPNLFTGINISQSTLDYAVDQAYNQLFAGDDNQRVCYTFDADESYIKDVYHNDVRSEGMSYGMMICVQLNKKEQFDKLWAFAKQRMQHTQGEFLSYFAWTVRTDGTVVDPAPAPDGEEYFATALIFACKRWGNGTGIYNYEAEARTILTAMLHQADDGVGMNMFDQINKKVVFCPTGSAAQITDPSYHLPAFYEVWARFATGNDAYFWKAAADTSRAFLKRTTNTQTGLCPNYAEFSGVSANPGWFNTAEKGDIFSWDAWRTVQNICMDWSWWNIDAWQKTYADRILTFFKNQGLTSYGDRYTLSGSSNGSTGHSTGLVAMNAVGALATTQSSLRNDFVNELWTRTIPTGNGRYYDGMLYMLSLLHVSGKFLIYAPGFPLSGSDTAIAPSATKILDPVTGTILTMGSTITIRGQGTNLSWSYDANDDGRGTVALGTGATLQFTVPTGVMGLKKLTIFLQGAQGTVSQIYDLSTPVSVIQRPRFTAGSTAGKNTNFFTLQGRRLRSPSGIKTSGLIIYVPDNASHPSIIVKMNKE